MPGANVVCSGIVDRIGLDGASIDHKTFVNESKEFKRRDIDIHDHAAGLREVSKLLTDSEIGVIRDPAEIEVVGHRVVHGGESFTDTIVINQEVKDKIKKLFPLAPLHNPPNYLGIEVAEKNFSTLPRWPFLILLFTRPCRPWHTAWQYPENYTKKMASVRMGFMAQVTNTSLRKQLHG